MASLWRYPALGLAVLVALLAAAQSVWITLERRSYEERVDALRAAGEPLATRELEGPPIPDEENAAKLLEEAAALLEPVKEAHPEGSPLVWEFGAAAFRDPWEEPQRQALDAYLDALGPYFALLEEIPSRPRWYAPLEPPDPLDARIQHIPWLHEAAQLLKAREKRGRAGKADTALLLLGIADRYDGPTLLQQLVRRVIREEVLSVLRHRPPDFDAAGFRARVDPAVAAAAGAAWPVRKVLRAERLVVMEVVERWTSGTAIPYVRDNRTSWFGRPRVYRTGARLLDAYAEALAEPARLPEIAAQVRDEWLGVTLDRIASSARGGGTRLAMIRAVMALLEHEQRTGAWPAGLETIGFDDHGLVYAPHEGDARIYVAEPRVTDWDAAVLHGFAWTSEPPG